MTFRFDDICINTDMELVQKMTDYLFEKFNCKIIYGISPLVSKMDTGDRLKNQRIFPEILNAMSDHRYFFKVDKCGVPKTDPRVILAGHGIVHVDHRLLSYEAQELSIITSCSLAKALIFIPPFNKWNKDTEDICREQGIELIRFENGWRSMEYNEWTPSAKPMNQLWYLHSREWTFEKFTAWFQK